MDNITVAIIDDQALVRDGIADLVNLNPAMNVACSAENTNQAQDRLQQTLVDILLVDIRLPGENGIRFTQRLRQQGSTTLILILTTFDDPNQFVNAMQAGANGYLLKDVSTAQLHHAITTLVTGGIMAEPVLLNQLNEESLARFNDGPSEPLNDREIAILKLMAAGLSNKEIAEGVFLAEGTVKNQVSNILSKLNTRGRTRAVLKAISCKII